MQTRTKITLTSPGLVLRALAIARTGADTCWHRQTIHEHMQDAMTFPLASPPGSS